MKQKGGCWSLWAWRRHIFMHLGDFSFSWKYQMSSLIWVIGHICSSVQMSNMNMLSHNKIRDHLNTLNTRDIIWLRFRLTDKKASYLRQNLQPPHELLIVLNLLKEQIHDRFEWIRIIQMCVSELMDKITS